MRRHSRAWTRSDAGVRIESFDPVERESPLPVMLAQAIAANDAMDYAMRKAVELGVGGDPADRHRAQRAAARRRARRQATRALARHRVAACEQCGRNRIPPVAPPVALDPWLASMEGSGHRARSRRRARRSPRCRAPRRRSLWRSDLKAASRRARSTAARAAGFHAVSFGPRVLRTETAARGRAGGDAGAMGRFAMTLRRCRWLCCCVAMLAAARRRRRHREAGRPRHALHVRRALRGRRADRARPSRPPRRARRSSWTASRAR